MALSGNISSDGREAGQARSEPIAAPVNQQIPVIGLVGGIGSGKSTVARHLASCRSVVVLDADQIGHQVLTESKTKQQLHDRFGDSVFDEQGNVHRAELGRRVFGLSAEQRRARSDLEQIVHPRIRAELEREIEQLRAASGVEAILLDAAVLLEAGWNQLADRIVFIDCPQEQRLARVAAGRDWDAEELKNREASQYSLGRKRAASDVTIDNSQDPSVAAGQLETILDQLTRVLPASSLSAGLSTNKPNP